MGLERVTFNRIHSTRSNLPFWPHVRTAKPVPTLAEHALVTHVFTCAATALLFKT